jgi:hypothetical protein
MVACPKTAVRPSPGRARTSTFRLRDGCSASAWSAPDGSGLLTLDALSVQTAPVGSRRIVWMIKGHPTENPMPSSVVGRQHDMGPTLCSSRTRCCRRRAVVLRLVPGLGPSLDDRPHSEQSDDGNHLTSEDDSIDVHRRSPAQLAVADDERSDRAGGHPKAATGSLTLTLDPRPRRHRRRPELAPPG